MSSPPQSPGSKKRPDAKPATTASGKTTSRTSAPTKPSASDAKNSKPKTKKELEAERLAAEEAERNKPPQVGSGQFEFPNGAIYDGEWQIFESETSGSSKKRHGFGRFTNGGEVYEGEWREGNIAGRGKYTFASGAVYDGEWLSNKFHGRGSYTWPSSARYIGDWVENKMHGNGSFLASTGDRYEGVFKNDRFQNAQGHWIAPLQSEEAKS